MVIPNVYGNAEGELEEAVVANPGELQEGVDITNFEAVDLQRITRSTTLYHLQDTWHLFIIP